MPQADDYLLFEKGAGPLKNHLGWCFRCGKRFDARRLKAGYRTCLVCGDKDAARANEMLREQVAVPFNKGAYQLIQPSDDLTRMGK